MKKTLLILLLIGSGLCSETLFAKDVRFYDSQKLTCNLITSICQDTTGFIWVATDYGLNRFNGVQFAHYYNNPDDSASLLNNSIRQLMLDRNGTLWLGFVNGLQYYLPGEDSFQKILFENGANPHITSIAEMKSGEIRVATSGYGICRVDMEQKKAYRIENIPRLTDYQYYSYVYEDSRGTQWFGINDTGLLQYNPATGKSKLYLRDELPGGSVISSMQEDNAGNLLVATSTSVLKYDHQNERFQNIPSDENWLPVRTMLNSNDGKIYLATYGMGLKYINNDLNYIESVKMDNPYSNMRTAKIPAIYEDRSHNLWLGCFQKGLFMFSNEMSPFKLWKPAADTEVFSSVLWDRQGNLFCSTENNGIFRMDGNGNVIEHLLEGRNFSSIFQDKAGNMWFGGSHSGLFFRNTATGDISELFSADRYKYNYMDFAEDAAGNLYISRFGKGIMRYNPQTQEIKNFVNVRDNKNSISTDWIYDIFIDSQGLVWFGNVNGLECYHPGNGKFTQYSLPNIAKYITYSLLEDAAGKLWAGTNRGLLCIKRKTNEIEIFQEKDGLPSNVVYAVTQDFHGNIWCSTLKGICKLNMADHKFFIYNYAHELANDGYLSNSVSASPDGKLFFGGTQGITVFNPDDILINKRTEQIALSSIYLNSKTVNAKKLSSLSFYDNTFTLEFTTFTFDDPANTFYEYRLKGKEEKWNSTRPGINQITYNQLPHGHYIIEARACRYGIYSDILPIEVRISPPWWQSLWAYLLYIALATFILSQIYFAVKRRHSHEMNEEKIKLFVNLSHEIRSPMTLIVNPLDTMLKKDYDEETLRMLRMMKKNANRIIGLINQLLDMRKIEKGRMTVKCSEVDLIPYIKSIMELYEYQVNKCNIRLCIDAEAETMPAWIDTRHFDKVLVNTITNALKYTPDGGIIKILLQERTNETFIGDLHHYIEIQILDTGKGIDTDKLEKIFERFYTTPAEGETGGIGFGIGLNLCRLIVKLHHGTITACNREDAQGSCFTIRIPYGNMHLKKDEIADETTQDKDAERYVSTDMDEDEQKPKSKRTQSGTDKILVVDDDEEILAYLSAELSGTYKVRTCNNGNDAWQIILADKPQLVISDVIMHGIDGYTLLKRIKKNAQVNHIPIILLTSRTESEERIKGIKFGADAYLNKPFNLEELKARAANLLESNRRLKSKFSGAMEQKGKIDKIEIKLKNDALMERIMKVINQNIANTDMNVDFLAREAGVSRVHLHRKLKEITGVPVATFIRNIRLNQATVLLRENKQDVAQVGYAVGFSNQANFATVFKKQFGVAPSKYAETTQSSTS